MVYRGKQLKTMKEEKACQIEQSKQIVFTGEGQVLPEPVTPRGKKNY